MTIEGHWFVKSM